MNTLKDLAIKSGTDKALGEGRGPLGYIELYEKYFEEIRHLDNVFLEIGVYRGDSIRMWAEYFTNSHIIGMDVPQEINPKSMFAFTGKWDESRYGDEEAFKDHDNVTIFLGDQGSDDDLKKLIQLDCVSRKGSLDIVVDDGSHFQYHMMKSLGFLFPFLTRGGLYIIEDIVPTGRLRPETSHISGGEQWWGHDVAGHTVPYHQPNVRSNAEWLGVDEGVTEINFDNAVDSTISRFIETKEFSSAFLTEEQNEFLTKNIEVVDYYKSCWQEGPRPNCRGVVHPSNFAVFKKKN